MRVPETIKKITGEGPWEMESMGHSTSRVLYVDDMVLKIEKQGKEAENETKMMVWLGDKLPVPEILCLEKEKDMSYLLMHRLKGDMSCAPELLNNPKRSCRSLPGHCPLQ